MTSDHEVKVVMWTLTTLALFLLVARLAWRTKCHNLGLDDVAITISMIIVVCSSAFLTACLGRTLDPIDANILYFIGVSFGALGIATPKFAVALLLLRILGNLKRSHKIVLLVVALVVNLLAVCNVIFLWFRCTPVAAVYDPRKYSSSACSRVKAFTQFTLFYTSFSATCDIFFAVYPAYQFWSLQIPTARKAMLSVMMGLGILGSAAGFYKTHVLIQLEKNNRGGAEAGLWLSVESNLLHIAACVPTLALLMLSFASRARLVISHLFDTIKSRRSSITQPAPTLVEIGNSLGRLNPISLHDDAPGGIETHFVPSVSNEEEPLHQPRLHSTPPLSAKTAIHFQTTNSPTVLLDK